MAARVTLKDIAQRAGVHVTTVSLALKNDPRLPPKTRDRLRKLADQMGYTPDAALRALSAYRQSSRAHPVQSALAYLTDMPMTHPLAECVYTHARAKASQLGYSLREFNLGNPNTTLASCMNVWWNTGIKGVLIGPFFNPEPLADGKWDKWVSVAYGYTVEKPDFNRVVPDLFHNLLTHLEILRARGYRRIGLLLYGNYDTKIFGLLHGAYLLDQARHGSSESKVYIQNGMNTPRKMKSWIRKERLDALVAPLEDYAVLEKTGLRIPEDIGFSMLSWKSYDPQNPSHCAGMDITVDLVAASAVSYLVSQLHENAFGLLDRPRCLLVPGVFQEGVSIRPAGPVAVA
ncbi:MAG: LacI family DNA-binding transcriptional regulator [Verrucomicrobiota bacterium JB024]|nr:LacI family DNA-binding transcriptional regulator [Verrucomicrobiota bacterium JB024]